MKKLLSLLLLCPAAGLQAAPAAEQAVATHFAVLIGFPSPGTSSPAATVVIPGSVILVDPEAGAGGRPDGRAGAEKALSFDNMVEKLWSTFRLDPLRRFQKGKYAAAAVGKPVEMPPVDEAGLAISASLQKFDSGIAVYRVLIRQGEKALADSTVNVTRGGRAVVGGLDGDQAPYIFLVIEPETASSNLKSVSRLDKSAGVTSPRILQKIAPSYPEEARRKKITGTVILMLQITEDGHVQDIQVLEYPDPILARSASDAVRQWVFEPARLENGKPVAVFCSITITYALK